jgi:hypothetical protein
MHYVIVFEGHVIEVGCGPFTQLKNVLALHPRRVQSATLIDPLLLHYFREVPGISISHSRPSYLHLHSHYLLINILNYIKMFLDIESEWFVLSKVVFSRMESFWIFQQHLFKLLPNNFDIVKHLIR